MSDACQMHEMTLKNIETLQGNQKDIIKDITTIRERIVIVEQSTRSSHHRLDSQEQQTKAIVKMSASVEYMAKQVEETLCLIKEHDGRLDILERAPGNSILGYWKIFVGAIVSAGGGLVLGLILKNGM